MSARLSPGLIAALGLGLAFLYLPLVMVILYSFNESRLVTVWSGFSVRWYAELFQDGQFLRAAGISFLVAVLTASLAAMLGVLAGYVLARYRRFKGRALFSGMVAAPIVMPEIITGLSMLLLFVAMEQTLGWPQGRGITTIVIAHTTFAMAYVAVIVQARLAGMERDVEEAAADLGARPHTVFFRITLPLITPAVVAGWLLAFALSLDDLVIASFVSGPQSTTLPMVVFSSIRLGVSPKINALATILIVVTVLVLLAGVLIARRRGGQTRRVLG